jgi:hypothetical protein
MLKKSGIGIGGDTTGESKGRGEGCEASEEGKQAEEVKKEEME